MKIKLLVSWQKRRTFKKKTDRKIMVSKNFPSLKKNSTKGQLISKWLFGILEFFQKKNKRIRHSTVRQKTLIHSFELGEESSAWKSHYDFVRPLVKSEKNTCNVQNKSRFEDSIFDICGTAPLHYNVYKYGKRQINLLSVQNA